MLDLQKLSDIYEVQQIASAYVHHLNTHGKYEIVEQVFTQHTPGQKVQITDWGVWEGVDAARRLFLGFMNPPDTPVKPVTLGRHELTSPYIVIADDGQTAIGVWDAPGWETSHYFDTWKDGRFSDDNLQAWWNWGAYWMAFAKEDGEWRVWQLKFAIGMNCPMEENYPQANSSPKARVDFNTRPKEFWPDRPGKEWVYRSDGDPMPENILPLPKPYKTWSDDLSII